MRTRNRINDIFQMTVIGNELQYQPQFTKFLIFITTMKFAIACCLLLSAISVSLATNIRGPLSFAIDATIKIQQFSLLPNNFFYGGNLTADGWFNDIHVTKNIEFSSGLVLDWSIMYENKTSHKIGWQELDDGRNYLCEELNENNHILGLVRELLGMSEGCSVVKNDVLKPHYNKSGMKKSIFFMSDMTSDMVIRAVLGSEDRHVAEYCLAITFSIDAENIYHIKRNEPDCNNYSVNDF
ncbi:uncharacterized protein LOC135167526 [Diachasmimorpha longicaudata]|uniref:uncharacterized protein LOC135167526 n=1 Tax=Diachasmimorpha longicaudata TaxID=58733 RepID=UPI0030B89A7E